MVPDSFIYQLLHGALNDLGLPEVAHKLAEEVKHQGYLLTNTPQTSTSKRSLVEFLSTSITNGEYSKVYDYLEANLKIYSTGGDLTENINSYINLYEILDLPDGKPNTSEMISIVLTILYLIKRIEFLEKLIIYLHQNYLQSDFKTQETDTDLVKFLSDELGPILDSIPKNSIIHHFVDVKIVECLDKQTESSKLLSLIVDLPLTDFQIENYVFTEAILFHDYSLSNNTTTYLINKLRGIITQGYFSNLFGADIYAMMESYLDVKLPTNLLHKIIEDSFLYTRLQCPHYLPSRSSKPVDFLPPIDSDLESYYKPRFPTTLLYTLRHHQGQVWFAKFSPLGKFLLTGAADGKLIIYDVSNDFQVVCTLISDRFNDEERFVNSPFKPSSASKAVIYCCWDSNEDYLVSGSLDTRIRVWDVRSVKNMHTSSEKVEPKLLTCFILGDKIRTWSCEFLPETSLTSAPQFIIGSPDKVLKAYDIYGTELFDFYANTRDNVAEENDDSPMEHDTESEAPLEYVDADDDSNHITRLPSNTSQLNLGDATSSADLKEVQTVSNNQGSFSRINDLAISPNGDLLVTANNNKQVDFYSIPDLLKLNSITKKLASISLNGRLTSCSISSNGKYLLLSLAPDELQVWDIEDILKNRKPHLFKKLVGHSQGPYIVRSCFGFMDIHKLQEEIVLSGSDDGSIYIWNLFTGRLITRCRGHEGVCNSVDWNNRFKPQIGVKDLGKLWCSVGDDKLVRIWGPAEFALQKTN